jgi:hypothetical protein
MIQRMISVPVMIRVSVGSGYGDRSVIDSKRAPSSRQPRVTVMRVPPNS